MLVLGLGIGANIAVFSVIDRLLFEPLPFRGPDRLAWVARSGTRGGPIGAFTVEAYEILRRMQTFEELTTYEAFFARSSYKLTGDADPDRVAGVMVPANFFPFLGVSPAPRPDVHGRRVPDERSGGRHPDPRSVGAALCIGSGGVIGRQVMVNDRPATIVGVMPRTFDFGAVFAPGVHIELYMPAVFDELREWGTTMAILGAPPARRDAEAAAIGARRHRRASTASSARSAPTAERRTFFIRPLRESIVGNVRRPMLTLWAAVGLVLMIVCINLSNLLLARGAARSRRRWRCAARSARGGTRLVRQLLSESLVLSMLGGGLGVAFAYGAIAYVRRLEGHQHPAAEERGNQRRGARRCRRSDRADGAAVRPRAGHCCRARRSR